MAGAASENDKGAAKGLTGKGKSDAAAVRKTHIPRTKRRKNRLWYERRTHLVPNTGTRDGGTKNGLTPYQTREQATAVRKTHIPRTKRRKQYHESRSEDGSRSRSRSEGESKKENKGESE